MKAIGFSSGTCWKFINTLNGDDQISFYRTFFGEEINAIEICLVPDKEQNFKLSKRNKSWMSSLNHISYHLTQWTEDTKNIIEQLPRIDYMICHIDEKYILDKMPHFYNILIENIENHHSEFFENEKICFDIAHCLSLNLEEPENFYLKNKANIRQIHLSNHEDKLKHIPLYKAPDWLFNKLKSIPLKNYPVIIESNFNNLQEAKLELKYLKEKIYD